MILAWSALASIPVEYTVGVTSWCSSDVSLAYMDQKYIAYLSVLISILMTVYQSIKASVRSSFLGVNVPEKKYQKSGNSCWIKSSSSKKPSKITFNRLINFDSLIIALNFNRELY
jgi:hypothetical protein